MLPCLPRRLSRLICGGRFYLLAMMEQTFQISTKIARRVLRPTAGEETS
jgi:hypothetical protein